MGRLKQNMGYFNILLLVAPAFAQISSNTTSRPNFNTTLMPTTTTTKPTTTTTMPPQPTTNKPTTTTTWPTTTTGEEVCTGHVCLPEEMEGKGKEKIKPPEKINQRGRKVE